MAFNQGNVDKLLKEATKASKGGFLKKPDWDFAAENYGKVAQMYQVNKDLENAKKYYQESSDCHVKAKNPFFAGKQLEKLAGILKDQKKGGEACKSFQQASTLYLGNNQCDKAAEVLLKGAKLLKDEDPDQSVEMLTQSCEILEDEKQFHLVGDHRRLLTSIFVKGGKCQEAIDNLEKHIIVHRASNSDHNVCKCYLEMGLIRLSQHDVPGARAVFSEAMAFDPWMDSDECKCGDKFVNAMDEFDPDALEAAKSAVIMGYIHPEIGRLGKRLKITGSAKPKPKPVEQPKAAEEGEASKEGEAEGASEGAAEGGAEEKVEIQGGAVDQDALAELDQLGEEEIDLS